MLPSGSLNQAMLGPLPRAIPLASVWISGLVVVLERHAGGRELVDRRVDVGHDDVEDGEDRGLMVGLRVDE